MFSRLILDNFKSFTHFEFDLIQNKIEKKAKQMAIIYGENAIGKSSVIDAFNLLFKSSSSIIGLNYRKKFFGDEPFFNQFPINKYGQAGDYSVTAQEFISCYKKIGSIDDMSVEYEGFIKSGKFIYKLVFDSSSIVGEKLFINGDLVFFIDRYGNPKLSDNDFFSVELKNKIAERFKMYSKSHSLLSCINSINMEINSSYFNKSTSDSLRQFILEVAKMRISKSDNEIPMMKDFVGKLLPSLVYGEYNDSMKERLELTKVALTMYFSSIYPHIYKVDYDISLIDGKRYYEIVFVEMTGLNESRVHYNLSSTGTKKLLQLFPVFYELVENDNIVLIDEIDSGINDVLLKDIFESLGEEIKGQLIVTTHNTLLLKSVNKKYIYLLDRDENGNVISYSLDSFGRQIQEQTDIIGRYLKGLYGGVPQSGAFSMNYIVDEVKHG